MSFEEEVRKAVIKVVAETLVVIALFIGLVWLLQ